MWQGDCFVFDERVAVNHQLEKSQYDQCHACRYPITEEDKQSEKYQQGVSCPRCFDKTTPEQRARFEERERQIQLAKKRGEDHIGGDVKVNIDERRTKKYEERAAQRTKNNG